jgi:hypothetical protein
MSGSVQRRTVATGMAPLELTSRCDGMGTAVRWQVRNPNAIPVDFVWDIRETGESGRGTAPAQGEALFSSMRAESVARLFAEDLPVVEASACLPPQPTAARSNVEDIARIVYDALAAGEDLQGPLAEVFEVFGVPTLRAEEDGELIRTAVQTDQPVVLDLQLDALDRGFKSGAHVTLTSAFSQFAELGVEERGRNFDSSISLESFTPKLAYLLDKERVTLGEALPTLILALGRERANRTEEGIEDPVWGDALLDPLQFALLLYAFAYLPAHESYGFSPSRTGFALPPADLVVPNSATATASGWVKGLIKKKVEEFPKDLLQDLLLDTIEKLVKAPLSLESATSAVVCVSVVLNSFTMTLTSSAESLHRRWTDVPDPPAWQGEYRARLSYDFTPYQGREPVLALLGCGQGDRPPS